MKGRFFLVCKTIKTWGRQYLTKTIIDADYTDDLTRLTNTPAQAESLLHSLEQAAKDIGLYMNSDKTKFMHFNQDNAISSLNDKSLKLVDHFIYLFSNISSTESDVSIFRAYWPYDRIKQEYFQIVPISVLL